MDSHDPCICTSVHSVYHHGNQSAIQLSWDEFTTAATESRACSVLKQLTCLDFFFPTKFFSIFTRFFFIFYFLRLTNWAPDSCVSSWHASTLPLFSPLWECNGPVSRTAASHLTAQTAESHICCRRSTQVNTIQADTRLHTSHAEVTADLSEYPGYLFPPSGWAPSLQETYIITAHVSLSG